MDEQPWDAACMVFVSPDRIQHCLLEYVHPGHPDHATASQTPVAERVIDVYRLLDRELGTLLERTDADDLVLLMSDHGHQPVTRALNMNRVLESMGAAAHGPRLGAGLAAGLGPDPLAGPRRLRPAGPARQGEGADHADRLGPHHAPTRASPRPARASRSRWPGASRRAPSPAEDYERVRDRGRGRAARLRRPRHRPPPDRAGGAQGGRAARPVPRPRARPAAGAGPAVQPHARAPDRRAGRLAVGRPPAGGRLRRRRSRHRRRRRRGDLPGRLRRLDQRARWASRSRPAPTRPSSRRWACSRTTRSARSRSGSAVSAISTDRAARPQRGLPGHQPCGRHSRESTPSRTAATRNSTNNEITITAPMAHHPFQVWNGGDRRPVRNTKPT